jgi:hypothetical protein
MLQSESDLNVIVSRSRDQVTRTLSTLQDLLQDAIRLSLDAGPQAITRSFEASQVILGVGTHYVDSFLQGGQPDRLPVLMRKTFERLGSTYIKLGQFIASSPSLFPEEYVMEFQKCLDKTDPVPFNLIRDTISAELQRPVDEARFKDHPPLFQGFLNISCAHSSAEICLLGSHTVKGSCQSWLSITSYLASINITIYYYCYCYHAVIIDYLI